MDEVNQRILLINKVIPILLGVTLFFSCNRDIEKVRELPNLTEIPAVYATGVETIYSDSSIIRLRIQAPELKEFPDDTLRPKQIEFPKGLTATFYNQTGQIESVLRAKYAIYLKKEKIFEARDSVVVMNYNQDQQLETDLLFWSEVNETIWSDHAIKIITKDGETFGDYGFEADQNFTRYTIRGSRGEMKVKTDENGKPIGKRESETGNREP